MSLLAYTDLISQGKVQSVTRLLFVHIMTNIYLKRMTCRSASHCNDSIETFGVSICKFMRMYEISVQVAQVDQFYATSPSYICSVTNVVALHLHILMRLVVALLFLPMSLSVPPLAKPVGKYIAHYLSRHYWIYLYLYQV